MRSKLLFCMAFATAMVFLAAAVLGAFDRRDRNRDIIGYNVLAEKEFKGIARSQGRVVEGLLYVPLKMETETVDVQIGPPEFVERSHFKFNRGDTLTVIGMPIVLGHRQVILAREVSSLKGVLMVRDDRGLPLWDQDPLLMDPERAIRLSELCEILK